jgi:hypothetical protein
MIQRMKCDYCHAGMDSTRTVSINGCKWAVITVLRVELRYLYRAQVSMFESNISILIGGI